MGMGVIGKNEASERGKYFRNNVWWWRPLADYILKVAPEQLTSKCEYWQTNDGAGLDDEGSKALGEFLRVEIAAGRTATYAKVYEAARSAMPQWAYHFSVKNVKNFADFLVECEGFEIW